MVKSDKQCGIDGEVQLMEDNSAYLKVLAVGEGKEQELAAKRATPEARVPETSGRKRGLSFECA